MLNTFKITSVSTFSPSRALICSLFISTCFIGSNAEAMEPEESKHGSITAPLSPARAKYAHTFESPTSTVDVPGSPRNSHRNPADLASVSCSLSAEF